MRKTVPVLLEHGRLRDGQMSSPTGEMWGMFMLTGPFGQNLKVISSGSDSEFGWEHVSVSLDRRPPIWEEMCFIKDLFWDEEEVVMQLHPPKSMYINNHPNCLHLWRPLKMTIPIPPMILVGVK